ncbi:hypothetical protein ACFYXD_35370 [Streptomyces platensis]|uniref:hypothetical protein n=1 Tax=Streptomyces platensis TaxID=58346 RepID=UPI003690536C
MALVDDIEFYGNAVDTGKMTRQDAVKALAEASNGGLTEHGAAESIRNWKTRRRDYQAAAQAARRTLTNCLNTLYELPSHPSE